MTLQRTLQNIINRFFKDDMTIDELEDLAREGHIDLEIMIQNEKMC